MLEYGQRLNDRARAVVATAERSSGRVLCDLAVAGGAQALGREAGAIRPGCWADLVALDDHALALVGMAGDRCLDGWIFTGDDALVADVWSAGRHVVREGQHISRDRVAERFREVLGRLRSAV